MSAGINGPPIRYSQLYKCMLEDSVCQNPLKTESDKKVCELYYMKHISNADRLRCKDKNKLDKITAEDYDKQLREIQHLS